MKLKVFILCFLVNFGKLEKAYSMAEIDYEHDNQSILFRAQLPSMVSLYPFLFTMDQTYYSFKENYANHEIPYLNTDVYENDRYRNCNEWLQQMDKSVLLEDIFAILYNTQPDEFLSNYQQKTIVSEYSNNSFVQFLSTKSDLLEYLVLAKEIEAKESGGSSRFEEWDNLTNNNKKISLKELISKAEKGVKHTVPFIRERYAYQLCRLYYKNEQFRRVIECWDLYFKTPQAISLMNVWACLFKAMSMDHYDKREANRLYAYVFASCNEKKMRSVQLFNKDVDYPTACTEKEKSIINTILLLNNPGPVLEKIQAIWQQDQSNPFIAFLILREINKLDYWIINHDNNVYPYSQENRLTDLKYTDRLKNYILLLNETAQGEEKDFYTIALAHLTLLSGSTAKVNSYLSSISKDANPTILLQKRLSDVWLSVLKDDINSEAFKEKFVSNMLELENLAAPYYQSRQILFVFTRMLADAYSEKGNKLISSLMYMRADHYSEGVIGVVSSVRDNYSQMEFFDGIGSSNQIEGLIEMIQKKKKSAFENYLLNQNLNSIDTYKDLLGTIAFRNDQLIKADSIFSSLPSSYWDSALSFKDYLNEDPFIPKGVGKRRFDYSFNKATFVKRLIALQQQAENPEESATANLLLGNAYFNTSYYGNAWMMVAYSWNHYEDTSSIEFGKNYYKVGKAEGYYLKVLTSKATAEQLSLARFMLHIISRNNGDNSKASYYAKQFYGDRSTNFFKTYSCPLIADYI